MTMPTDRATLLSLAKRCEEASGGDRALDCAILAALYPDEHGLLGLTFAEVAATYSDQLDQAKWWSVAKVTASLDQSLALLERVLPGWRCCVFTGGRERPWVRVWRRAVDEHEQVDAPTPALAMCAAILKALAEKEQPDAH
jgi:hypothetical protein